MNQKVEVNATIRFRPQVDLAVIPGLVGNDRPLKIERGVPRYGVCFDPKKEVVIFPKTGIKVSAGATKTLFVAGPSWLPRAKR